MISVNSLLFNLNMQERDYINGYDAYLNNWDAQFYCAQNMSGSAGYKQWILMEASKNRNNSLPFPFDKFKVFDD